MATSASLALARSCQVASATLARALWAAGRLCLADEYRVDPVLVHSRAGAWEASFFSCSTYMRAKSG
eukprot:6183975-Pleurochrysis_carterae.AAC.3